MDIYFYTQNNNTVKTNINENRHKHENYLFPKLSSPPNQNETLSPMYKEGRNSLEDITWLQIKVQVYFALFTTIVTRPVQLGKNWVDFWFIS